jgi:hypothetical protein
MENIGRHISAKFDLASLLVEKLGAPPEHDDPALGVGLPSSNTAVPLRVELEAIRTRYTLCTSHLFFQASSGESGRLAAREEFQRIVASEHVLGELDYLVRRAQVELGVSDEDLASKAGAPARRPAARGRPKAAAEPAPKPGRPPPSREIVREVRAILDQYNGHEVDCAARTVEHSYTTHGEQYNLCGECKLEMAVKADTSELACPGCGKVRELIGTVFDDAQFYNQEGQKAKSGSFNPNRHFRFWMDRILAREPEEELGDKDDPDNTCGEKLLALMRTIVRRDRKILRLLTVDDTRAMLKEAGRTDLNKNVPLIMRRLTGVGPPSLPETICQRVEKLFSKAIDVGERVRPVSRSNRNYYPYYIYKILDAILEEDDHDNRRVLYYIYMQGQDTLDKNDREWEEICVELPEIEWAATNRTKAQKYRPL